MAEWDPTEFQATLRDFLGRRGWSQNELHFQTSISQGVINRWLHEDARQVVQPTDATLRKLAPVIGLSHSELMRMAGRVHAEPPKSRLPRRLSQFLADIEAGWLAADDARRQVGEEATRAIFNPHAPRRPGRSRANRPSTDQPDGSTGFHGVLIPAL